MKEIVKTLTFNTAYKTGGTTAEPIYIPKSDLSDIEGIRLRNVRIPLSVYNINSYNNMIKKNENGTPYVVSIAVGNYNSSTISNGVKSALNSAGQQAYDVVFNSLGNTLTITNSSGNFKFVSTTNDTYNELGFNDISSLSQGISQTSQVPIDLSGIQEINILSNVDAIDIVNKNYAVDASIPVNGSLNSIYNYSNSSDIFSQINSKNLSEISFELKDHRFRSISQDLDWSLTLDFKYEG